MRLVSVKTGCEKYPTEQNNNIFNLFSLFKDITVRYYLHIDLSVSKVYNLWTEQI